MTFHAYLQYVCLLVVCLCTLPSPMEARVQADRQSTGTRDTLLVIDQESGLPIEGADVYKRQGRLFFWVWQYLICVVLFFRHPITGC